MGFPAVLNLRAGCAEQGKEPPCGGLKGIGREFGKLFSKRGGGTEAGWTRDNQPPCPLGRSVCKAGLALSTASWDSLPVAAAQLKSKRCAKRKKAKSKSRLF